MEQNFLAAFKSLNTEQRQAVEAIDGPVMVVAGPGTGKTQLLSLRVAQILRQTDADASSILCLTFTNFAATNMRERLSKLVGSQAHNVVVRTFHSFAAEVMNLYPDYFWNGARLSIAPDAVQLEIIQDIMASLPLNNPLALKFAGNFTMLADIQQAMKLTKEAGLTPEKLQAMLMVNIEYLNLIEPTIVDVLSQPLSVKKLSDLHVSIEALPDQAIDELVRPLTSLSQVIKSSLAAAIAEDEQTGKTTQTGKWKRRWLQTVASQKGMFDERRRIDWWLNFVDVYASYRRALHQRGYYDYSDMLLEVISQLEQQPELLASVQERFLYVLIDEFQDTNKAQLRLAHLVASHPADEGKPNIMAVGDDDQSIFGFNGAELSNMLSFKESYPSTKLVVLQQNYRSSQAILDAAKTIIEQADERLVKRNPNLSKNLQAANEPQPKGTIKHSIYPTREHQLADVAHAVQQQWQQNSKQTIAVLARSHDSLQRLSAQLHALQVSVKYERQSNILDQEVIKIIMLLAETILAINQGNAATVNHNIAQIIRHPIWKLDGPQLWQLAQQNYSQPDWLNNLLSSDITSLAALGNWLIWLGGEADRQPLAVMLEYLLGLQAGEYLTSPIRDYYLALRELNSDYLQSLSASQILLQLAGELATEQPAHLADLVRFYQINHDLKRTVSDESWFTSGEQAVQLLTVHKSKGSEFDVVYVIDAVDDSWKPSHYGRKPPANLPLQPYGELYDDYVRLLYVAATRAKRSLYISSYAFDGSGRQVLPTPLINALDILQIGETALDEPIQLLETSLHWPSLTNSNMQQLLKPRLDNYRLSATALLQFLDVTQGGPQNFLERQLLRLPQPHTTNLAFGTAIHAALQTAQYLINEQAFTVPKVIDAYTASLQEQQLQTNAFERYKIHGKQTLEHLFAEPSLQLPSGGQPEVGLQAYLESNTNSEELSELITIHGKLDHVFMDDQQLLISDYKTGKPLTSFQTHDQAKAIKAWRHKTQLLFYALLAQESGRYKNAKTTLTQMIYVEAETPADRIRTLEPTQLELDQLKALIVTVWKHIVNLDFPDTSNYSSNQAGIDQFQQDLLNS